MTMDWGRQEEETTDKTIKSLIPCILYNIWAIMVLALSPSPSLSIVKCLTDTTASSSLTLWQCKHATHQPPILQSKHPLLPPTHIPHTKIKRYQQQNTVVAGTCWLRFEACLLNWGRAHRGFADGYYDWWGDCQGVGWDRKGSSHLQNFCLRLFRGLMDWLWHVGGSFETI